MTRPNRPKKQHYLPQAAYLSHFQCPNHQGYIFQLRRGSSPVKVSLGDAGAESHLYTFQDEGGNNYAIEEHICGAIDGPATPVMRKLNSGASYAVTSSPLLPLLAEERDALMVFVAFQAMRTPAFLASLKGLSASFQKVNMQSRASYPEAFQRAVMGAVESGSIEPQSDEQIEELRAYILKGEYKVETGGQYYIGMMLELFLGVFPFINSKRINLIRTDGDDSFVTSDHPVVKIPNSKAPAMFSGGFIFSALFLPVGPKTGIWLSNTDEVGKKPPRYIENVPVAYVGKDMVRSLNLLTIQNADKYVFSAADEKRVDVAFQKTTHPVRFSVSSPFEPRKRR